ncbi:MAG: murein biosynthesis integral membrane protein MurJ [Alphaproteobacteria bacterium]|nr:murein biosynthesis integral membrane protein MurJ [Alphaproteobacteria bacterium]
MARQSFVKAFIASVLGTGLSRVLGLVRDVVIGNYLGAGATADAFWMAWTVPNAFRRFVADEGLTGALVPGIARAEAEEGTARAQTLANRVLTALLLVNAGIVALGVAFPEALVYAFAYGFTDDPEKYALTVGMTQVLMPFLTMVSIVSFFEGLLNHRGHFFVPKVAPGLVSAGIAGVAVLFANAFDEPAWALVAGVWVGGIAHILIHLPWTRRLWGPVGLDFGFRGDRFQVVVRELGKVVVIGLFAQVNILVLRQMASFMMDGAVSRYTYATRLVDLAQGIIAVAIGSALLPNISTAVANADWDRFRSDLTGAFRLAAFLLVPAAVGLFVYAVPLTSLVFLRGRFTLDDVTWTATCLQLMTPFMLGVAGVNIVKKVFFALEERNSLLVVGAIGVVVTGVVGYLLMGMDINGLAIALSIATVSQLAMYLAILRLRLGDRMPLFELLVPLAKMIAASVPLALFAFWAASHGVWSEGLTASNLGWFVLGIVGGAALYGVAAWLLGIGELRAITSRLTARLRR